MIRVNRPNVRALGTGRNVQGAASTVLETGPKDALETVDAYEAEQSTGKTTDPAANNTGPGGAGAGETRDSLGNRVAKSVYAADRKLDEVGDKLNNPEGTGERVTSTMWEALLCGSLDPNPESSAANRARLGRTSLWLRSTGCGADDLLGLLSMQGGQAGINRDELRRRLEAASDNTLDVLREEEMDTVIAKMAEVSGEEPGTIQAIVNGAEANVGAERSGEVSNLSSLMEQYTGVPELIQQYDLNAEVALLDTVVSRAIDLGVPQAYETVMGMIEDERVKAQVALGNLRLAAVRSDLSTINSILDLTSSSAARAKVPNITSLILQYYTWGHGTRRSDYVSRRDELIATLNRVDANWARKQRSGQWVDNLEPFSMASDQALTLLKQSEYGVQAMVAPDYHRMNYRNVTRRYHPYAIDFAAGPLT